MKTSPNVIPDHQGRCRPGGPLTLIGIAALRLLLDGMSARAKAIDGTRRTDRKAGQS